MESTYPKLALGGRKNECTISTPSAALKANTVFFPISEVSEGTVFCMTANCWGIDPPSQLCTTAADLYRHVCYCLFFVQVAPRPWPLAYGQDHVIFF